MKDLEKLIKSAFKMKADTLLAFGSLINETKWLALTLILGLLVWTLSPVLAEWLRELLLK